MLARAPVEIEIFNDNDERVINWWRAVRDRTEEFGWLIEMTPRSRAEFAWACDAAADYSLPPLRRALAFHIIVMQCITRGNHAGRGSWLRAFTPAVGNLGDFAATEITASATRFHRGQLESCDANELLERISGCDYSVVYIDPPYPTTDISAYAVADLDYGRMGELLQAQSGAVGVSGFGGEWDMLGWEKHTRPAQRRQIGDKAQPREEVLWLNPKAAASKPRLL